MNYVVCNVQIKTSFMSINNNDLIAVQAKPKSQNVALEVFNLLHQVAMDLDLETRKVFVLC